MSSYIAWRLEALKARRAVHETNYLKFAVAYVDAAATTLECRIANRLNYQIYKRFFARAALEPIPASDGEDSARQHGSNDLTC